MHEEVQQLVVFGMSLHRGVVVSSLVITAVLVLLALLVTRNMKERPSGVQSAMEYAYEYLVGVIESSVPEGARGCAPVVITLFLFILFSNLIGVIRGLSHRPLM